MLRYLTAGESHGPALVATVDGLPAGLKVTAAYINRHLTRRRQGYGRGGRMRIERDQARFLGGVRGGETLGGPVAILIENRDWNNWRAAMDPEGPVPEEQARRVTRVRPGHADLAGALKYDRHDARDILERASARETAGRVAAGALTLRLLEEFGVQVIGHVLSIGTVRAEPSRLTPPEVGGQAELSPVRCSDAKATAAMVKEIDEARRMGDSVGGVVEVLVTGLPPGLGSHVQWDRKLDARLAAALMSIQAVKGVEVGLGFEAASRRGSAVHDEIFYHPERGFYRSSNNAGGIEGGMSNGEPLTVRAAVKPIATLYHPLQTVDLVSKAALQASVERSDICAVPAVAVIAEAAVAFVLAEAWLEKFGGDSLAEVRRNHQGYVEQVRAF